MSTNYSNSINLKSRTYCPEFRAEQIAANNQTSDENSTPIEKLVTIIDEGKKKKHNQIAMTVGGSVLGLSLLVSVLNPKISTRNIQKLKQLQTKINNQLEKSKGNLAKTKFYKFIANCTNWSSRFLSWTNNVNSVKDTYYKQLCTEDKTFFNIKDLKRRERFAKYDNIFRKIMQKPHELITKWGDSLAKRTVRKSYKKSNSKMDSLEELIKKYSEKLQGKEKQEILESLEKIKRQREYFSEVNLNQRFLNQEELMKDLNEKMRKKWQYYKHGFKNKYVKNTEHFNQNLSFWAQDMMGDEKKIITDKGRAVVENLVGNSDGTKGEYNQLIEKLSSALSTDEKASLNKALKKVEKSLNKANNNECCEYFDKKRDLILGSAPTDILTGTIGLTIGGISLATANDKDKRISRLITSIIPAIAGFGVNIALTAMLFSGTKGMLYGIGAGGVLSLIGSKIDKKRLEAKNKIPND